jgi:hypothetical protein
VGFVAFGVLLLWRERKKFHGQIMLGFLLYYGVMRYALENIRGDADRGDAVAFAMSTSQLIGILVIAAVAVFWWKQSKRGLYVARGTAAWGIPPGYVPPGDSPAPSDPASSGKSKGKRKSGKKKKR